MMRASCLIALCATLAPLSLLVPASPLVPAFLRVPSAQAQVAAMELAPPAPRYYATDLLGFNSGGVTPDNPAVLQWEKRPRLAFGAINLEETYAFAPQQDFSGYFAGFRGKQDDWAFGLEYQTVGEDSGSAFSERNSSGAFSIALTEYLAVGGQLEVHRATFGSYLEELESNTVGASISARQTFFIGYAVGREKYEDSNGNTGSRDTSMVGVAIRTRGEWRWHLAYDRLEKEPYEGLFFGGFDVNVATAQVIVGDLLAGIQVIALEERFSLQRVEGTAIDVGWAPDGRLTVTARLTSAEQIDPIGFTILGSGAVLAESSGVAVILTSPF